MTRFTWVHVAVVVVLASAAPQRASAQGVVPFEQTLQDLGSGDARVRLRAAERLKQTPYDEAAVPLSRAILDPDDAVQMEAIRAELNIFLAEPIVPRRRVGLIVEVRNQISAQAIFQQGSRALDPRPVPPEVLTALRTAGHDEHPQVAVEALYAFGVLADNAYGRHRLALLASSPVDLAAPLGAAEVTVRTAALRAIARVYAWRPGDPGIPQALGDPIVTLLNDRSLDVQTAAHDALAAMRYARAVQALTEIYQHYERGTPARMAIATLARIAHPSSEPLFVAALSSRDASIRAAAIEGLARLGAVGQAQAIGRTLETERNEEVLLAGHFANVLLSEGSIDALVEGLTHPQSRVRSLQYLAEAIPGRASILAPHMPDPQPAVRIDLLEAVGLSGDPSAASLAERLKNDPDPAVVRAAQRALARLEAAASPAQP